MLSRFELFTNFIPSLPLRALEALEQRLYSSPIFYWALFFYKL